MSISLRETWRGSRNESETGSERLREGGLVRADYWGWTNTAI
jgi:hypothetical protein